MRSLRQIACSAALFCFASGVATAGWPWTSDGPLTDSEEYYHMRSADLPGARQRYHHGKVWPVQPRPVGPPQKFIHKFHHAHYWPLPYQCWDRAAVVSALDTQALNGWRAHTTLHDFHFDSETGQLNSAGRAHLQWIATAAPEQHRRVFVSTTPVKETNSARLANVQQEMQLVAQSGVELPILLTPASPNLRSAELVEPVHRYGIDNPPDPTIGYQSASGAAGGAAAQ